MRQIQETVDLCVVGGGMAGLCAAVAAARMGISVAIMQDRPMFGGNASSEIRMHICGAHGRDNRETGILEEILLDNFYRNPTANFAVWDSVLHGIAYEQPNLLRFMNCVLLNVEMRDGYISAVSGYQLTNETQVHISAKLFADCTGDGTLAFLAGADFRIGREAQSEHGETIPPVTSDSHTMGMSCLLQIRETGSYQQFTPPNWAHVYTDDSAFPHEYRNHMPGANNYWWIELGGDGDVLHDAETLRDELLKVAFGVWDHVKNRGDHGADNWVLEWIGLLPGKRESRRFMGDHILTQHDLSTGGVFDDVVAYGGWTMDDHHPQGFAYPGPPTTFHPCPSPYGIPYRSLYSHNIPNLFLAGRNISATHAALSSTRVMGTCAIMGQAVGCAAALAIRNDCLPRTLMSHIKTLQEALLCQDVCLPGLVRELSAVTLEATLTASENPETAEYVRDGYDRAVGDHPHGWAAPVGAWICYRWKHPVTVTGIRLVFDSDLNRSGYNMPCHYPTTMQPFAPPPTLVKSFRLEWEDSEGRHEQVYENHQRLVHIPIRGSILALRFVLLSGWGAPELRLFSIEVESHH